jgi:predicted DNA-binding antitoxin AbrB/MazE fold protein
MSTLTVRAVFENGVFRPLDKVELPEKAQFEFEPRPVGTPPPADGMEKIYEVLSRRYASGHTDTAERHNEHKP